MINKLLDDAKAVTGSDRQTAMKLGYSAQFISDIRRGKSTMPVEAAARLAGVLGRSEFHVICEVEAAQARTARSRDYWATLKKRTVATAATILLAANVKAGMVDKSILDMEKSDLSTTGLVIHYAKYRSRRKKSGFGRYGRRRTQRPRQMYWRFG